VALVENGLNFKVQRGPTPLMLFSAFKKCRCYLYVFVLEIPITSKLKHCQVKSVFRRNAPQTGIQAAPSFWGQPFPSAANRQARRATAPA
jgi:hypothetical protein